MSWNQGSPVNSVRRQSRVPGNPSWDISFTLSDPETVSTPEVGLIIVLLGLGSLALAGIRRRFSVGV
jgi:hypothetical protein